MKRSKMRRRKHILTIFDTPVNAYTDNSIELLKYALEIIYKKDVHEYVY